MAEQLPTRASGIRSSDSGSASSNPSDFLLLSTTVAATATRPSTSTALPRPRFVPLLQLAALCDFSWTFIYAMPLAIGVRNLRLPVSLCLCRPVLVTWIASSSRVRERGTSILAQLMLSFLVLLWHVNQLVQTNSSVHLLDKLTNAVATLAVVFDSHGLRHFLSFHRDPTVWYITSFAFAVLHYVLFAIFVGISRRRNPFVGRRVVSSRGGTRRASVWGEQGWTGVEQLVRAPDAERDGERRQLLGNREPDVNESEGEDDVSFSSNEGDEDEDDIVDIPRPSLRSRKSTASFFLDEDGRMRAGPPSRPDVEAPTTSRATSYRHYGSLAGI